MENVSHKSITTDENVVNQLELSHGLHHPDRRLWLPDLFQEVALIRRQVREPLHSVLLLVLVIMFWKVVLVEAVNVEANDEDLLKAFPHNVLLLGVAEELEVMWLE